MNSGLIHLPPGLHLVATPIGNARDITLRALDVLASADVLAAEDTRTLRRLLEIHGIALRDRPLISYHEHNGPKARPRLLAALEAGQSVAYASDAGTPLIADPGFDLARAAVEAGLPVIAVPGPTALAAAVSVAALPTDRLLFEGFLPNAQAARRKALETLRSVPATLVFYESPRRLAAMLADAAQVLGPDRRAAVCRELTKKFEECLRGTLEELAQRIAESPVKGEVVVVVDRGGSEKIREIDLSQALDEALKLMTVRDAAAHVAQQFDAPKRQVYQLAMERQKVRRDATDGDHG